MFDLLAPSPWITAFTPLQQSNNVNEFHLVGNSRKQNYTVLSELVISRNTFQMFVQLNSKMFYAL